MDSDFEGWEPAMRLACGAAYCWLSLDKDKFNGDERKYLTSLFALLAVGEEPEGPARFAADMLVLGQRHVELKVIYGLWVCWKERDDRYDEYWQATCRFLVANGVFEADEDGMVAITDRYNPDNVPDSHFSIKKDNK